MVSKTSPAHTSRETANSPRSRFLSDTASPRSTLGRNGPTPVALTVRLAGIRGATHTRYVCCVDQCRQHPNRGTRYGGLGWGTVDDGPVGMGRISLEVGW